MMNKIITTALLLAAGTVLSSAVTLITTSKRADVTEDNGKSTISLTNLGLSGGETFSGAGNFTMTFVLDANELKTILGNSSKTEIASVTGTKTGGGTYYLAAGDIDNNSFSFYANSNLTGQDQNQPSDSGWVAKEDGDSDFKLDTSSWDDSTQVALSYAAPGKLYLTVQNSNSTPENYSLSAVSTFKYDSFVNTNGGLVSVSWKTDLVKYVEVYAGVASAEEAQTLNTNAIAASVPEPSAFGLLAGLGALALVASRRRRSRK